MTAHHIIAEVAKAHATSVTVILGPRKWAHLVAARIEIATRLRALKWSYPAIGHAMRRDKSSIMNLLGALTVKPGQNRKSRDAAADSGPADATTIIAAVARDRSLSPHDICSRRRNRTLVAARRTIAQQLAAMDWSYAAIAMALGRSSHGSALNWLGKLPPMTVEQRHARKVREATRELRGEGVAV